MSDLRNLFVIFLLILIFLSSLTIFVISYFFFLLPVTFNIYSNSLYPLRAIILHFKSTGYIPACRGPLPYSANGWQHGVRRDGRAGE